MPGTLEGRCGCSSRRSPCGGLPRAGRGARARAGDLWPRARLVSHEMGHLRRPQGARVVGHLVRQVLLGPGCQPLGEAALQGLAATALLVQPALPRRHLEPQPLAGESYVTAAFFLDGNPGTTWAPLAAPLCPPRHQGLLSLRKGPATAQPAGGRRRWAWLLWLREPRSGTWAWSPAYPPAAGCSPEGQPAVHVVPRPWSPGRQGGVATGRGLEDSVLGAAGARARSVVGSPPRGERGARPGSRSPDP